jgi:hypothetical protein
MPAPHRRTSINSNKIKLYNIFTPTKRFFDPM